MTSPAAGQGFDIVLKGGRVLDERNGVDGLLDVAIKAGRRSPRSARTSRRLRARVEDVSRRHRRAGADRYPHPRLPQGDLAQRRPRLHRPPFRLHHSGRCGQRRRRQL